MPRKMITSQEAADRIGVSISRIQALLRQRRIPGARLVGRVWMVPENFSVTPGTRGPALQGKQIDSSIQSVRSAD